MYYLESSCAIQVRAQSGGGELIPVPKEVMDAGYAPRRRPSGSAAAARARWCGRGCCAGSTAPTRRTVISIA